MRLRARAVTRSMSSSFVRSKRASSSIPRKVNFLKVRFLRNSATFSASMVTCVNFIFCIVVGIKREESEIMQYRRDVAQEIYIADDTRDRSICNGLRIDHNRQHNSPAYNALQAASLYI